ncbi:MAG: hypothetical protein ACOC5U_04810 [Candidatus Aminicenantaceae bacterium]
MKKIKGMIIIVSVAVSLAAFSPALEAGKCEDAFLKCINDPVNTMVPNGQLTCGLGYLFCKKYIEPLDK